MGGVHDGLGPVLAGADEAGPLRGQAHKAALPPVEARVHPVLEVAGRRDDGLLLLLGKHPGAPSTGCCRFRRRGKPRACTQSVPLVSDSGLHGRAAAPR